MGHVTTCFFIWVKIYRIKNLEFYWIFIKTSPGNQTCWSVRRPDNDTFLTWWLFFWFFCATMYIAHNSSSSRGATLISKNAMLINVCMSSSSVTVNRNLADNKCQTSLTLVDLEPTITTASSTRGLQESFVVIIRFFYNWHFKTARISK